MAGAVFRRHMAFVYRLVRQHRLADHIADGINVRHIGALLFIHFDKAAIGNDHTGFFRVNQLAVGRTAGGYQHQIVTLRLFRCFFAFESHINAVFFGIYCYGFGVGHDVVETVFVQLLPNFYQIAVGALHQAVHHFHYIQAGAQRAVHRTHF